MNIKYPAERRKMVYQFVRKNGRETEWARRLRDVRTTALLRFGAITRDQARALRAVE